MDNEYISKLKAAIDHNWEEQIATLGDMVAIPSVAGEAVTLQPGTPDAAQSRLSCPQLGSNSDTQTGRRTARPLRRRAQASG